MWCYVQELIDCNRLVALPMAAVEFVLCHQFERAR